MGKEKNINKPTTEKVVDKQEIVDKEITPEDRKKLAQEKIDNIEEKVKQFKEEFKASSSSQASSISNNTGGNNIMNSKTHMPQSSAPARKTISTVQSQSGVDSMTGFI